MTDTLRKPPWLTIKYSHEPIARMKMLLARHHLHTVCESAMCPNIATCFPHGTATFMILGDVCTRRCRFCAVGKGRPAPVDEEEPERVAEAATELGLKHIVVTSVTRDDLPDGGAGQFAATIAALRRRDPSMTIEVLIPDFLGVLSSLEEVVRARPNILGHNVETVPRLYPKVRPQARLGGQANYQRSLEVLARVKGLTDGIYTKSGLMVGLGETEAEVCQVMADLRGVGCDFITIGQYLRPSLGHLEVAEYLPPETFDQYGHIAEAMGFLHVASAPLVRSSYLAEQALAHVQYREMASLISGARHAPHSSEERT